MNPSPASNATTSELITTPDLSATLRHPVPVILAWAVYSLCALGYFGYQNAWLGFMCIAPR